MLKLRIERARQGVPLDDWSWSGDHWTCGRGWLAPYQHPALNHELLLTPTRTVLLSWERGRSENALAPDTSRRTSDEETDRRLDALRDSALDHTRTVVEKRGVTMFAGAWSVAPVYLQGDDGALTASWDPEDMLRTGAKGRLLDREVARLLQTRHRYGHDTLWHDVFRLSERSRADWIDGRLTLSYPPTAEHVRPRDLKPRSDVLAEFGRLVHEATTRRHATPDSSAIELSGGLDSANVLVSLGEDDVRGLVPTSIIMSGDITSKQIRRRESMIDAYSLAGDLTFRAEEYLPFGNPELVLARTPYVEPWYEAKNAMLEGLRARGVRHSFGGTGGDELIAYGRPNELPVPVDSLTQQRVPWLGKRSIEALDEVDSRIAPPTVLPETTLLAFASRAPVFLRNGIWPVSPLADPVVGRFAESLPGPWCWNKTLHRLRLASAGLDRDIYSDVRDDPSETLTMAVRANVIPFLTDLLRQGSVLVDEGFVDADALRGTLEAAALEREERGVVHTLLKLATIEAGLQAVT